MKYGFKNRKGLFFSWLLSSIFILFIPLLICGLVYYKSLATIEDETGRVNASMLYQLQQGIDGQVRDVERLAMQIALDPNIESMIYRRNGLQASDHFAITKIINNFSIYKLASSYIKDFYVYLKNNDIFLTTSSKYDPKLLYQSMYNDSSISFEEWYGLVKEYHRRDLVLIPNKKEDIKGVNTIAYMQSLPVGETKNPLGSVTVILDESKLNDAVNGLKPLSENKGNILIMNKNGSVLFSAKPVNLNDSFDIKILDKHTGFARCILEDKSVSLSYIKSDVSDWIFISAVPDSIFMGKVKNIRNMMYGSILLSILLGYLIAYIISKRNYNPVRDLVNSIAKKRTISPEGRINEFKLIKETIRTTMDENEKVYQQLHQQNTIIRSNILSKLVKGSLENNIPVEDILSKNDIHFYSDFFLVILIYIEENSNLSFGECNGKSLEMGYFTIKNILEELSGVKNAGYVTEVNDMLTWLFNFKELPKQEERNEIILDILNTARDILRNHFEIYITVAVSSLHETYKEIPFAYYEALDAMEFKAVKDRASIIFYDEVKGYRFNKYSYTFDSEYKLVNYIKSGDYENARSFLKKIIEARYDEIPLGINMRKILLIDILGTIIKTKDETGDLFDDSFFDRIKAFEQLSELNSVYEMVSGIDSLLKDICRFNKQKIKTHSQKLIESIKAYIDEHYSNGSLSVFAIAAEFGLNPDYLSRFFSEHTGGGLLDYIIKVRLNKAKELLRDQKLSINDIARKVGYYDSNTIIRTFKKYEGITPGQFRKLFCQ